MVFGVIILITMNDRLNVLIKRCTVTFRHIRVAVQKTKGNFSQSLVNVVFAKNSQSIAKQMRNNVSFEQFWMMEVSFNGDNSFAK